MAAQPSAAAMETIGVDDARERLDDLLDAAASGEDVVIGRGDGSSFRIVPVLKERVLGLHPGAMQMLDGFDDPLPEFYESTETDPLNEGAGEER